MDGETAAALREIAAAHGPTVTPKQLLRWHTVGLLPRPRRRHLGRGRGTQTVYPAGTAAQLLALLKLHEGRRLRVERAGFALWYDGWPVDVVFARDALGKAAADWAALVARMRDEGNEGGLSDEAWSIVGGLVREHAPALRAAYRRAGQARAKTFRFVLLQLAAGTFGGFDEEGRESFMEGMGFARRRLAQPWKGAKWLEGHDVADSLLRLQETLRPDTLRTALDATAADELALARDEWRALLSGLDDARAVLAASFGGHSAGLTAAPSPAELDHDARAALLLAWLSLRRLPEARDGLPLVLAALAPFSAARAALDTSAATSEARRGEGSGRGG